MPRPLETRVEIKGIEELARDMREAGLDVRDLTKAGRAAAKIVLAEGRARAPRRSGTLARNLRVRTSKTKAGVIGGNNAVLYAGPIHWGWPDRRIRENQFLSRAAVTTQSQWLPEYIKAVDKATAQVKGVNANGGPR
jgi:hypothetical protein